MQLHELKRKTPNKKTKRVGRGGGRGKTSGRGTKGQKARAGHKQAPRLSAKAQEAPEAARRLSFQHRDKPRWLMSLAREVLCAGDTVNPKVLLERGLIRARKTLKAQSLRSSATASSPKSSPSQAVWFPKRKRKDRKGGRLVAAS
jgi:large subunit ribosomal protein L15